MKLLFRVEILAVMSLVTPGYGVMAGPPPDFTITATPILRTIGVGTSTSYSVQVDSLNGFDGLVSLSVDSWSLPAGVTAEAAPASVTGSGKAALTVNVDSTVAVGSYTISVVGDHQGPNVLTHSASVALVVTSSQPVSIFDGETLDGWLEFGVRGGWDVDPTDAAITSTGAGRGGLYTKGDYDYYRIIFTMRHVYGVPGHDHQAAVLVFCTRPPPTLNGLGAIQFQVPNGGHWDYRPGHNDSGARFFTRPNTTHYDAHAWSQVELLVNAWEGTVRMAVAQPPGTKAVENLVFGDPEAIGLVGPFALQSHNAGLIDQYKDITLEVNPAIDDLITTK